MQGLNFERSREKQIIVKKLGLSFDHKNLHDEAKSFTSSGKNIFIIFQWKVFISRAFIKPYLIINYNIRNQTYLSHMAYYHIDDYKFRTSFFYIVLVAHRNHLRSPHLRRIASFYECKLCYHYIGIHG